MGVLFSFSGTSFFKLAEGTRDARGGGQGIFAVADRREHKEQKAVDAPTAPRPSWHCLVETLCFDLPTGEGAPSKVRGLGEFLRRGQGEEFPLWVRAKPVRLAML